VSQRWRWTTATKPDHGGNATHGARISILVRNSDHCRLDECFGLQTLDALCVLLLVLEDRVLSEQSAILLGNVCDRGRHAIL